MRAPRINDKLAAPATGECKRFSSAILPPWCRKSPKASEVLPLPSLHDLSTGDFAPALGQFLGGSAGLSGPVITKPTERWKAEQRTFAARDLAGVAFVYLRADGVHVSIRLEERELCLLMMNGGRVLSDPGDNVPPWLRRFPPGSTSSRWSRERRGAVTS